MRFSASVVAGWREVLTWRGEAEDGGVSWVFPSKVANECCKMSV